MAVLSTPSRLLGWGHKRWDRGQHGGGVGIDSAASMLHACLELAQHQHLLSRILGRECQLQAALKKAVHLFEQSIGSLLWLAMCA
jgi:hypothetical protein